MSASSALCSDVYNSTMCLFSESVAYNAVGIFIAFAAAIVALIIWRFSFWKRHGFPFSLDNGMFEMIRQNGSYGEFVTKIYREAKQKQLKHIGTFFFLRPTYIPIDLGICKHIFTKDFHNFMDRGLYFNEEADPLRAHIFHIEGRKWKALRQKLSPTFSSGQIKIMFQTLVDCGQQLRDYLNSGVHAQEAIDIKDILARLTTDIIGSCAFGIQCNTLENPDAEFRKYGKLVFDSSILEMAKFIISFAFPRNLLRFLGFGITNKNVTTFFRNVVEETINYREKNNIHRKDFMQLLLQLKNKGTIIPETGCLDSKVSKLTMNEIAAQAFVFYIASFETSATAMTFASYELALNQAIQDKTREEINAVLARHDGKLTYEGIMEMHYLQRVIEESLRKYPPLQSLDRHCRYDYKIPGTDLVLPKNTHVNIPVMGIQHDPEYYPDPERFDPDRFTEENKSKRPHYTYLSFGEGPRNCLGLRFGLVQTKVGLVSVLRDYKIKLHPKTEVPLSFDPKCFVTTAKDGVYITMEKIGKQTPAA